MQWQKQSDIDFLGDQDAADVLEKCNLALMLGEWNGKGYFRCKVKDGRAVWVRRSVYGAEMVYAAFLAPWGSLFDTDTVETDAMIEIYKPDGWRTKTLDGIRTYATLSDEERALRAKAREDKAREKRQEAAALKEDLRAAKEREKAEKAAAEAREASSAFMEGEVTAIECKATGRATLCRILRMVEGAPVLVRMKAQDMTMDDVEAAYPRGYVWRSLAKWPDGRESEWRRGRMSKASFWALSCRLGVSQKRTNRNKA